MWSVRFGFGFGSVRFGPGSVRFGFDPVGFWLSFVWDSFRVGAVCASCCSIRARPLVVVGSNWLGFLYASFRSVLQALPLGLDAVGGQVGSVWV